MSRDDGLERVAWVVGHVGAVLGADGKVSSDLFDAVCSEAEALCMKWAVRLTTVIGAHRIIYSLFEFGSLFHHKFGIS